MTPGMRMMLPYVGMAFQMANDLREMYKIKREELTERWEDTKSMPRKKKKKLRKQILREWSINEWTKENMFFF